MPAKTTSKPIINSTAAFARYVGLARTTVSRVFNNQPGLRPETIERVQKAMEEVGFKPNPYAVFLLRGRTGTVGVCMRQMDSPTTYDKVFILQQELRRMGFNALIESTGKDFSETERILRHFMLMRAEGVILLGGFEPEQVTAAMALVKPQGLPTVFADQFEYPGAITIVLDRAKGMEELVVHLYGLGHRRFGLLGIRLNFLFNDSRIRGIQLGLQRCGLEFESAVEIVPVSPQGSRSYAFGRQLAEAFLARLNRPTAFLGLNDEVAIGAMWRFQEAGLKVPQDISVTGFNNMEIAQHVSPTLTSVDQRADAVMTSVAEQMAGMITNPKKRLRGKVIAPELVFRGSVGPMTVH